MEKFARIVCVCVHDVRVCVPAFYTKCSMRRLVNQAPFEREKRMAKYESFLGRPKSHFYRHQRSRCKLWCSNKKKLHSIVRSSIYIVKSIFKIAYINRTFLCEHSKKITAKAAAAAAVITAANQHLLIWTQKCTVIRIPR